MVVFTVFIDGGLEDVHAFTVEEGSRGIITVTLPYTTAVAIDDTFEIKTDGTTWIKGKVQRIKIQRRGMTNTKVLTCYGKTHTLYEKYCLDFGFHQYFNKDVGWIANDLVDHYFGGILTSVNVNVATGVDATNFECDGRSIGEALEDLARRGDCNFYVDNDDDVHFFIRPGAASGLTAEDLGELKIVDESGRKFVKVIVRGRHRAIQASAGAGYPEFFYQDDRIISTAEAGEVATAMVAELGATRQVVVARKDSFMETRAGKTIILNVPADGFNDQVIEIQKIRWVCKPPNLNKTYFTLGDKEPTIDSVLAKLARGVSWLPDVQIQRGVAFPTDPFDGEAFTLINDVAVPGVYYGAIAGILYTWDEANSVWKRPPCNLGRRAVAPDAGGEAEGDTYFDTTDDVLYQWTGITWEAISQMGEFVIDSGIAFPAGVVSSYFYRTDLDTLFRCESTGPDVWKKVVLTTGEGAAFPAEATLGTLFYKTDEGILYRCNQALCTLAAHWSKVMRISNSGTYAARPGAGDIIGEWYYSTDTMELYRWTGAAWEKSLQKVRSVTDVSDLAGLANVATGDTCYVTNAAQTFYYDGANWVPLATIAHQGTTAQRAAWSAAGNASEGDIWYDTTLKQFFRWTGAAWEAKTTWSHDDLDDVGENDHHDKFTSGQHAVVEHTAAMLNQAVQPYNSNILFERKAGHEENGITYTAGNIAFQDGTIRVVTNPGELLALPVGYNFIYFKTDSALLFATDDHPIAVSAGRGILAIIVVVSADDPDLPCAIQPFYAKGLNLTADTLAVTLLSAITSYLGNVTIAAGKISLGDAGITLKDAGELILYSASAGDIIVGRLIPWYQEPGIFGVGLFGENEGNIRIASDGGAGFTADAGIMTLVGDSVYTGATFKPGGPDITLGSPGIPGFAFKYFIPATALVSRPDPVEGIHGLLWIVTAAGANDKMYVCLKNDANDYEWVQTGIST